jgi:hypothetical protein
VGRLGPWQPCVQAAEAVAGCPGVTVSEPPGRRRTAGAGAAYEAGQPAAVETLEAEWPPAPLGSRVPVRRVEGAMVPRLHHAGAAVKTVALGALGQPVQAGTAGVVHPEALASGARLSDAEPVGRLALVDTPRRGTATARTGGAVRAGAVGSPGVVDLHRPEAGRLVACPHALGEVAPAGQAGSGEGTEAGSQWCTRQRQALPQGDPAEGLRA